MNDDSVDHVDPTPAKTSADLARYMQMLRVRADSPAYRVLEKRALGKGRSLPRTTLGEVLSGRRFPSKAFLLTFVELCGVDPTIDRRWEITWNRLAIHYKLDGSIGAADPQVTPPGAQFDEPVGDQDPSRPHLSDDVLRECTVSVARAAAAFQVIGGILAEAGRWDLIESGLRPIVELGLALRSKHPEIQAAWETLVGAVENQGRHVSEDADYRALVATRRDILATTTPRLSPSADVAASTDHPEPRIGRIGLPAVWNVEPRNPEFTGRDPLVNGLHSRLGSRATAVVQALRGMGGIGKTQIAIEYAYRFSGEYDLVWWIAAEDSSLIANQLAALARQLRLVEPSADIATATAMVKAYLRSNDRWLLIFDNAEEPSRLREWLPGGPGHVVITSRAGGWDHIAGMILVDLMTRDEAIELLCTCYADLTAAEADQLAASLGDLPLALSQAGGFLAETASTAGDYLELLSEHAGDVLSEGMTGEYPRPLAVAITLSENELANADPVGLAVLWLCSYLAPETVPVDWLIKASQVEDILRAPLTQLERNMAGPVAIRRSVAAITRLGLATSTREGLRLHRLTQAVTRDHLPAADRQDVRSRSRTILTVNAPGDPEAPADWPKWARMMPHLLAVDPATSTDPGLRDLVCDAAWYLIERGDAEASIRLAADALERWSAEATLDTYHTLWVTRALARAHRLQGHYTIARELYEQALPVSREVLGEDHPHTLRLFHGFAIDLHLLGDNDQARRLQAETFERYRNVLGEDHPHTLHSANHLGVAHYALGEYDQARRIHEDTLNRYRRVVGDNHPDTLRSANNLAVDLRTLKAHEEARSLQEDTLARRRTVLGESHPDTLFSATSLSQTLFMMGLLDEAEELQRDALVRVRKILGNDHPETQIAATNLQGIQNARSLRRDGEQGGSSTGAR
ncbi:MAG TPA: FxSxx-COOH system tetratricopeptide repeat protein [Streptosporangiaceae bacterium]|nr:FxSxx-COOH system tetratricopeptide repeat protein [Streptosporangiaceae bacterium]